MAAPLGAVWRVCGGRLQDVLDEGAEDGQEADESSGDATVKDPRALVVAGEGGVVGGSGGGGELRPGDVGGCVNERADVVALAGVGTWSNPLVV